jgi:hypothetical protein
MKRILMTIVWFVVLWFGFNVLCGAVVGGMAGFKAGKEGHPQDGGKMGAEAATKFSEQYGNYVLVAALVASIAGGIVGFLPGTKSKKATTVGDIIPPTAVPPPLSKPLFVARNGQQLGPFPIEEIQRQIRAGTISSSDLGWSEGMQGWTPLSQIPGII